MRGWQIDAADEDYIFSLNHLPIVYLATGIIPLPSSEIHITFMQIFSSPRRNIFLTAVKSFNLRGGTLSSPRRKVFIPEEIRNDLCNNLAAAQPVVFRYDTLHYVPHVPLNSPSPCGDSPFDWPHRDDDFTEANNQRKNMSKFSSKLLFPRPFRQGCRPRPFRQGRRPRPAT